MLLTAEITTADLDRGVRNRVAVLQKALLTAATAAGVLRDPYARTWDAEIPHLRLLRPVLLHHWNCRRQGRMISPYFQLRHLKEPNTSTPTVSKDDRHWLREPGRRPPRRSRGAARDPLTGEFKLFQLLDLS
jgi:hypothetical protein